MSSQRTLMIVIFGMLLCFGAAESAAGATQTFGISMSWVEGSCGVGCNYLNPDPIDSTSAITIDTTTGQVVSSNVKATGNISLFFSSQQSGTGFTLLTFAGGATLLSGGNINITLHLYLPVASLVAYSGGLICDATNPCAAGGSNEVVQCSGLCTVWDSGTFAANTGDLTSPRSNVATYLVSASGLCSSYPCSSPVSISGYFTLDLTLGVVNSGYLSLIDTADLNSSPVSVPLNLQFQFPPNQTLFFRQPNGSGSASYVQLIFPFNSFSSAYSGGPLCAESYKAGCPGLSGAAIGPSDQSASLSAVTGGNGDAIILTNGSVSPAPVTTSNPTPLLYQPLVPSATPPGGPAFTLTVNGTGFVPGATVQWNGTALSTTLVNFSQLTAAVPASNIATASTAEITVVNPTPGGGLSNTVFFPISNPTRDVVFQAGTALNGSTGIGNNSVVPLVAGDFTGTGILDLISTGFVVASGGPAIPYWRGKGDGTFGFPVPMEILPNLPGIVGNILDAAVGDFNGDGKLDAVAVGYLNLATANPSTEGTISFLAGMGNGAFQPFVGSTFPSLTKIGPGIAIGDVNGDGHLDVVAACQQFASPPNGSSTYQSGICVFAGNGSGTFSLAFSRFYSYPFIVNSIVLGDFNGDGKLDIVASGGTPSQFLNPGYLGFLFGIGDGTFLPDKLVYETTGPLNGVNALAAADLDHDGKLDLVFVHDCAAQRICTEVVNPSWDADFLRGNGDGTFQPPITAHDFPFFSPPLFGDFNADGNLDVSVLDSVFLLHSGGSTAYPIPPSPMLVSTDRQVAVAVGDFNGDGRLDLISIPIVNNQDSILPLLQVAPAPDFEVAVSSSSQTVTAGGTATFTVTITGVNGFNGVVTPSQTGFPAGTTVSYNPATVTGSGTIVITITTSTTTPKGTYPLAGSLTSGSIVHSGTLFLTVQ